MIKKILLAFCLALIIPAVALGELDSDKEQLFSVIHDGRNNYFEVDAEPGQTLSLNYSLENRTSKVLTNNIMVYDAKTAVNGGNIVMSPENYQAVEIGLWFSNNLETVTLNPGEDINRLIGFTVPSDCLPGIYVAIFGLYSDVNKQPIGDDKDISLQINQYFSSTLAIVIKIGENPFREMQFGEDVKLETNRQNGEGVLYIPIYNCGTAYEFPTLYVDAYNDKGENVFSHSQKMDIIYGKTDTFACMGTKDAFFKKGTYTIKAVLKPAGSDLFTEVEKDFYINFNNDDKQVIEKIKLSNKASSVDDSDGFFVFSKNQIIATIMITISMIILISIILIITILKIKKRKL